MEYYNVYDLGSPSLWIVLESLVLLSIICCGVKTFLRYDDLSVTPCHRNGFLYFGDMCVVLYALFWSLYVTNVVCFCCNPSFNTSK